MKTQYIDESQEHHTGRNFPRAASASTVEYHSALYGKKRKPNAKMALLAHQRAGTLLKDVYKAELLPRNVEKLVNHIRSILDDWAMCEYPHHNQPANEELFNLYYDAPDGVSKRNLTYWERYHQISNLERVKEILAESYPDCTPLRKVEKVIDRAINALVDWKTREV